MLTWTFEETVETTASATQIWAQWSQPETWPSWDDGVEWVKMHGPFAHGSKGEMRPAGGPIVKFVILDVVVERSFKDRSFLPFTALDFTHVYTPAAVGKKATINHRVEMRGLLTPLFSRVIGSGIKKGLRGAMTKLARAAEAA